MIGFSDLNRKTNTMPSFYEKGLGHGLPIFNIPYFKTKLIFIILVEYFVFSNQVHKFIEMAY